MSSTSLSAIALRVSLLAAVLCCVPSEAHGQRVDPEVKAEAAQRYKRGLELFKEDNYEAALVEFRKAYALTEATKILYNIGQVCYQMQDYVCALESFQNYANASTGKLPAARMKQIRQDIAELQQRIGRLIITVNQDGAEVAVDDVIRGTSPLPDPVVVNAGRHKVTATKEGFTPTTRSIEVAGADEVGIRLELQPPVVTKVFVEPPKSKWGRWSWVGIGASIGLGVVAAITGGVALQYSGNLGERRYVNSPDEESKVLRSSTLGLAVVTDVLAVLSAATLGVTLYLTLARKSEAPRRPAAKPADAPAAAPGEAPAAVPGEPADKPAEPPVDKSSEPSVSLRLSPGGAWLVGEF